MSAYGNRAGSREPGSKQDPAASGGSSWRRPRWSPAQRRYAAVFDWGITHTMKFENGPHGYTLFKVGERSAAGAFQFEPEWGVAPAWQVYFEVTNFDASVARACALGGQQGFWRDAPNAGRIGVVTDPERGSLPDRAAAHTGARLALGHQF